MRPAQLFEKNQRVQLKREFRQPEPPYTRFVLTDVPNSAYAQMGHLCLGHLVDTLFTPSGKPFKSGLLLCKRECLRGPLMKLNFWVWSRAPSHSKLLT